MASKENQENWSIHDKINTYKRLIAVYEKEKKYEVEAQKIRNDDANKKIALLKEEIGILKNTLDEIQSKDRNEMDAALEDDKEVLLALSKHKPQEAKKKIMNFIALRTKKLDILNNKTAVATDELIQLKKNLTLLERYATKGAEAYISRDEQDQLQSQLLEISHKMNTTKNVGSVLKELKIVLEKENVYHSTILNELERDAAQQLDCIVQIIQMSQLAKEDEANFRQEHQRLARQVQAHIQNKQDYLDKLQQQYVDLKEQAQNMVPAADLLPDKYRSSSSRDVLPMHNDVQVKKLRRILKKLKSDISVPQITDIYPRILELLQHSEKLKEDMQWNVDKQEMLENKIGHCRLILEAVKQEKDAFVNTSFDHKERLRKEKEKFESEEESLGAELSRTTCELISIRHRAKGIWDRIAPVIVPEQPPVHGPILGIDSIYEECRSLIDCILRKGMQLRNHEEANVPIEEWERNEMLAKHSILSAVQHDASKKDEQASSPAVSVNEELFEDQSVPSRAAIKEQAQERLAKENEIHEGR